MDKATARNKETETKQGNAKIGYTLLMHGIE